MSARYAVSDATSQQTGTDIAIDYDPGDDLLYVGYVAADGNLWYTTENPASPTDMSARYAVTDATSQQTGTAMDICF